MYDRLDRDFDNAKAILDLVQAKIMPAVEGWQPNQPEEWWLSYDATLQRTDDIDEARRRLVELTLHGIAGQESAYAARRYAEQALEQKLPPGNVAVVVFALCKASLAQAAIERGETEQALKCLREIQEFSAGRSKIDDERLLTLLGAFAQQHKDVL